MPLSLGAWLSAAAGALTGALFAHIRSRDPSRKRLIGTAIGGALIAALCYGVFLLAGLVIGVLTFSSTPDPGPALICVLLGCAAFLLLTWLASVLRPRFGMPPPDVVRRRGLAAVLDAQPSGGTTTMWLAGVGLALLPALYGLQCLVTRKGKLGTTLWPSTVEGGAAIALGLGWIAVGAFLHFHFFFGLHPERRRFSRPGKLAAMVVACAGLSIAGVWSAFAKLPRTP